MKLILTAFVVFRGTMSHRYSWVLAVDILDRVVSVVKT